MPATTNTYLPRILWSSQDYNDIGREVIGNTAEKIRVGDPIIWNNSNVRLELLTAATEDADFVGIALEEYDPDREKPVDKISYSKRCTVRVTATGMGSAQEPGTGFKWGTDGSMTPSGVTQQDIAGWLHKATAASATEADVNIDVLAIRNQFGFVSA